MVYPDVLDIIIDIIIYDASLYTHLMISSPTSTQFFHYFPGSVYSYNLLRSYVQHTGWLFRSHMQYTTIMLPYTEYVALKDSITFFGQT